MSAASQAPAWFGRALAQVPSSRWVTSAGARIHCLEWNPADTRKPGLLFVHGMLAHAHWWDFIAPFFTGGFRVCAVDLAGMGESAHREHYSNALFVQDIVAAVAQLELGPAVLVGHSFGGSRVLQAAATEPTCVRRAVVLDSRFHVAQDDTRPDMPVRPPPVFASEAEAFARYRLLPDQDCPPWLMHHLARHSIRPLAGGGWTWRFDPCLRGLRSPNDQALLGAVRVPVDLVYGGLSALVDDARARELVEAIPGARGPVCIPEAAHHLMLDQPLGLVAVLRALLASPGQGA